MAVKSSCCKANKHQHTDYSLRVRGLFACHSLEARKNVGFISKGLQELLASIIPVFKHLPSVQQAPSLMNYTSSQVQYQNKYQSKAAHGQHLHVFALFETGEHRLEVLFYLAHHA
jgi:hypothetical protein